MNSMKSLAVGQRAVANTRENKYLEVFFKKVGIAPSHQQLGSIYILWGERS